MKRYYTAIVLAFVYLVLTSCSWMQAGCTGTIQLSFLFNPGFASKKGVTDQAGGKAIVPSDPWAPARYEIQGLGPGGNTFNLSSTNSSTKSKIAPGEWAITATAYAQNGKELGTGQATCLLYPGKTTNQSVTIYPKEGKGSLSLAIVKNLAVQEGSIFKGRLEPYGLPGRTFDPEVEPINFQLASDENSVNIPEIEAGHYLLTIKLFNPDGSLAGGMADSVIILTGFETSGTCTITMGNPEISIMSEFFPSGPLESPIMSASHAVSDNVPFVPLAIPGFPEVTIPSEELTIRWFVNGEEGWNGAQITGNYGLLPQNTYTYLPFSRPFTLSLLRADCVASSDVTNQSGSGSVFVERKMANENNDVAWYGAYDYRAASGPALFPIASQYMTGTGTKADVAAVAASPAGLIVVAGLDKSSAIHAFIAGYQAEARYDDTQAPFILPPSTSWIRAWRDEIKINTAWRSPDRLAVSGDGRYVAAASSASNWLRLYTLDQYGNIRRCFDLTGSETGNMQNFSNIKGITFSADSSVMYVLTNSKESVYSFNISDTAPVLMSNYQFSRINENTSLSMQDITITTEGSIIATASEASRIYVLKDVEGNLILDQTIEKSADGSGPVKPQSLQALKNHDGFACISNGNLVQFYQKLPSDQSYHIESTFTLPPEAANAKSLAMTQDHVAVLGAQRVSFLDLDDNELPIGIKYLVPDADDTAGIFQARSIVSVRGACLLGCGSLGMVSVISLK